MKMRHVSQQCPGLKLNYSETFYRLHACEGRRLLLGNTMLWATFKFWIIAPFGFSLESEVSESLYKVLQLHVQWNQENMDFPTAAGDRVSSNTPQQVFLPCDEKYTHRKFLQYLLQAICSFNSPLEETRISAFQRCRMPPTFFFHSSSIF